MNSLSEIFTCRIELMNSFVNEKKEMSRADPATAVIDIANALMNRAVPYPKFYHIYLHTLLAECYESLERPIMALGHARYATILYEAVDIAKVEASSKSAWMSLEDPLKGLYEDLLKRFEEYREEITKRPGYKETGER